MSRVVRATVAASRGASMLGNAYTRFASRRTPHTPRSAGVRQQRTFRRAVAGTRCAARATRARLRSRPAARHARPKREARATEKLVRCAHRKIELGGAWPPHEMEVDGVSYRRSTERSSDKFSGGG